jgi:PKD repeat protein
MSYLDNNESDGPINCTTNLDCGSAINISYCQDSLFITNFSTPTCMNAGTEQSYCTDVLSSTNNSCNYICSNSLGCDYTECSDSTDNDADQYVDYPLDLGCIDYYDDNESDGPINCTTNLDCGVATIDSSCNALIFSITNTTPTCFNAGSEHSYCENVTSSGMDICDYICSDSLGCDYTECSDSTDNDADQYVDYPLDLGCIDYYDDNESDGTINCTTNLDCGQATYESSCNDLFFSSLSAVPTCMNAGSEHSYCVNITETYNQTCNYICSATQGCDYTECSDSTDNDADQYIDYPFDLGCIDYYDNNESDGPINCSTNSDCGIVSNSTACLGMTFQANYTVPTCNNAGTEHSFCSIENVTLFAQCNHICNSCLGCDYTQCSDGVDNDADSFVDYPLDLGCYSYYDNNESDGQSNINCTTNLDCGNPFGTNYCDSLTFMRNTTTPTCVNAGTANSYCILQISSQSSYCSHICSDTYGCDYTQCSDGADNDGDSLVDYPLDSGCTSYADNNESNAVAINCTVDSDCGASSDVKYCDGLNFRRSIVTPICMNAGTENSYCSYNIGTSSVLCSHICSDTLGCDYTQCSDNADNDADGLIDYPYDLGCSNYLDNNETNSIINCTMDSDCGISSTTRECHDMHYMSSTTTYDCVNPGTEQSYCTVAMGMSHVVCNHICSNESGCDYTQCSDGVDNDADSFADYPLDIGCYNYYDNNESNAPAVTNVTASIIAVPSSGVVPLNVSFDANATGPGVLSYYWDFDASNGIQNDSTVKNLIVQYGTVGNYTVTLTVLSDNGLTGSATVTKVINVLPFTPEQILPREVYDKVDADALIERMSLSSEVLKEGQVLSISFEVRNRGDTDLEDVKLQVSIPEIGLSRKLAPFDVDKGQSKFKTISLVIPEDVQPGEYTLRATIISDGVKRVQHREIKIV